MRKCFALTSTAAALALAAVLPATASARAVDGIPDGWERAHHLSLYVNQANLDQDHDGLDNKNEYKDHTNPRLKDTDRDGVKDGDEDADRDGASNRDEQESDEKGDDNNDQGENDNERGDNEDDQGKNEDDQGENDNGHDD